MCLDSAAVGSRLALTKAAANTQRGSKQVTQPPSVLTPPFKLALSPDFVAASRLQA